MNLSTFNEFKNQFLGEMVGILNAKGADYAGAEDRLRNFKEVAQFKGTSPESEWATYFLKHVFAVLTWIRTGKVSSEELRGRFLDIANYAILGAALAAEKDKIDSTAKSTISEIFTPKPMEKVK